MRDELKERYPYYLPRTHRMYCVLRKVYRQSMVRYWERQVKERGSLDIVPDGVGTWAGDGHKLPANPKHAINKAAFWLDEDMQIPGVKKVAAGIQDLKKEMQENKLCFTTTAGTFITRMFYEHRERNKLWENTWTIHHSGVKPGERVLDVGGASTIFSFYLAGLGCDVSIVDNDWSNCGTIFNTNYVAKRKGWRLKALDHNVARRLPFDANSFDHVFCICVIEHLSSPVRRFMMKEIGRVMKPGGIAGFTTDYDHERPLLLADKGLRFAYKEKFHKDVIEPSGLSPWGNTDLIDTYPEKNFLGAFFLIKK